MISIADEGRLLAVSALGEFTLADYREFEARVLPKLADGTKVDLLVDLRDMLGYTVDVAWEDIKFSRSHASDFRRIAVVTTDEWMIWVAWLERWFVDADVRVFDDEPLAREWLAEAEEAA